ncbi:protein PRR14L isoform X2 [Dromiciops gliroides]|uniref:protein PRR14L isoform X2 n=1 Tax=Dromiciops gliroides TaxID=33562 RepID=UPI001CC65DDB|nr:protein PRR14L isoform X2 [Dromiciops gliroides]
MKMGRAWCCHVRVVLGKQTKQELNRSPSEDEPRPAEENQGNTQVTTETLPKPTEEGQGMKVNGTKMISNAEPRNDKVSKSLPPGCIDCPDVDKITTSGEVSETNTLVSLEPLTSVEPGLTKAPLTEKECEMSSACPLRPPPPEDGASLPPYSGEVLSKLSLDHEAIDNHQHNCGWDIESPSKTSILQVKSEEGVLPLEADPQRSYFPLSLPCEGPGRISLKKCGSGDHLQKMKTPLWTGEVPREEGSASRLEEEEGVQSVRSTSREELPVDAESGGEESSTPPLGHALRDCCRHSPSRGALRSVQQENSVSPSERDPMKGPPEIQENFKEHKSKRVTCPHDTHQDEDSIEENDSSVGQTEPSVVSKNVDSQNPGSLVSSTEKKDPAACSVPDQPPKPVNQVSGVSSDPPQLQTDQPETKETIGILSTHVIPFVDGQSIASHGRNELESSEDNGKLLCVLSAKRSFDVCEDEEATAPQEVSLGGDAEDLSKGISEACSVLEDGDKVIVNQQTLLTRMSNVKDAFCPGATTCAASSQNHNVCAKAVNLKRVPNNIVRGKPAAVSSLEKDVAERESAQSWGCHSCHHRAENASEGDVTYKSTAVSPEAKNQLVSTSEETRVPSDLCPGAEGYLLGSILSGRHSSGENKLPPEETEGHFKEGEIGNEVASCSVLSRALNKSTLALNHVKPGNFTARSAEKGGLEENKPGTYSKESSLPCESHPSEHTALESRLFSNISSPKELKDLCLNTEHSGVRVTNQASGTHQGLNCQSDLNSPVECGSESESSSSKHCSMENEDVAKPNKGSSFGHQEALSNVQPSCGLPKKTIFKGSLGNEESDVCRADPAHPSNNLGENVLEMKESDSTDSDRRLQPDGPLRNDQPQREVHVPLEGLTGQDSILPCASDSFNVRSLKTVSSCKGTPSGKQRDGNLCNAVSWESKKLCQALGDGEVHVPVGSSAPGVGCVTRHEPDMKLSGSISVLLESIHPGKVVEGMVPGETQGTTGGLRPQMNSVFDEDSLEVYSKGPLLRSAETTPLSSSSQENLAPGSDGPLGEKAETKQLPEPVGVKVLPTLKSKVKKRPPGRTGTFQPKLVSRVTPSSFELNPENERARRETEEQQGTGNDLEVREEAAGETWRKASGDKSPDAYRPCFKRKRMCGDTEAQKAQIVRGCEDLKGGRESTQLKERGTFSQQEASRNARPFIGPTVGSSSQDLASPSRLKGCEQKQRSSKDMTGAKGTREEPLPPSLKRDHSGAGRQALHLCPNSESSLGHDLPVSTTKPQGSSGTRCENNDIFAMSPYQRKSLPPLKKGLNITYEPIKTGRKMNDVQRWSLLKNVVGTISIKEHRVLGQSSAALPSSAAVAKHTLKSKATRRLLLKSARLQEPTKESALLNKLSVLAGKLLAVSTAAQELGSQPCSAQLLPLAETYRRLRLKKLQDESPDNMMQLNLCTGDYGCNKTLDRQTALYPLEALRVGFLDLMNRMPSLQFNTQIFPISFHISLDSELTPDSPRIFSEHCSPPESAPGGGGPVHPHPPQSPKWTFSFLVSQGSAGTATFREEAGLSCELLSPGQAPGSNALVKVRAGCSVLGLPTVLALSSPGCYRIWTRRRSLSSHLPTIQRLFMTQFTQGFKGLRLPASLSNSLFPSLPHSVGRALSIWSQHGPSACPFEITALHPKHSKWPPTLGIRNSHAILPHVPLLGMETTTDRTRDSPVRPGPPFSALAPKSCLAFEPVVSVLRLSASDLQIPAFKELRRVPPVCSSQHSGATQKEIEPEKRPKKVSQIRIRKTIPRPDPNLTPMGLPRPKRLKKKEFSLEEIYTNKNYKSPPTSRCLETIFEEPKERNGALISVSQQKRKRVLEFQDFTVPRKRRNRGKIKVTGSFTRAKKAALQSQELDALLIQKLMDLEAFLAKEGEEEPASGC